MGSLEGIPLYRKGTMVALLDFWLLIQLFLYKIWMTEGFLKWGTNQNHHQNQTHAFKAYIWPDLIGLCLKLYTVQKWLATTIYVP